MQQFRRTALAVSLAVLVGGSSVVLAGSSERASRILNFTRKWLGTPYLWGGTTRRGIDCSAYLRQMYRTLFDIDLPRTTKQQIKLGVPLTLNAKRPSDGLHPGDLIFYLGVDGRPNHVVIFAGNDTIVHSVSRRGVVVDPIRKVFGRRIAARRFLIPRAGGGSNSFQPIPAAGPLVVQEIPCPPSFKPRRAEIRKYSQRSVQIKSLANLEKREICDFRALADAVEGKSAIGRKNALVLRQHAEWLQSLEHLKGLIDGDDPEAPW